MKKIMLLVAVLLFFCQLNAQNFFRHSAEADTWVDSVYSSLTPNQRIAQLMVIRESGLQKRQPKIYAEKVKKEIKKYNVGAICLFQGSPAAQAKYLNQFQQLAKTPLMVCIDAETGLGMRMSHVQKFPDQLTMGAMQNADKLLFKIGEAIGEQCKRIGVNVNYAPVVDINNNPNNPVIGYRSFGQNKELVARYGVSIMKGMQHAGIMACAKHFPGHGDVSVDSHLDLPVITKTLAELDTLELYPFKKIFKAGIGSVMIAHLSIPAIDSTPHLASSLSHKFVTDLLRNKMGFTGISFTDALEMKGVSKYFPPGEVAVKSLIAGNDMLCLPKDVAMSMKKINDAFKDGRLQWADIEKRLKKVLYAKYNMGLAKISTIDTEGLLADLNKCVVKYRKQVASLSLTAVRLQHNHFTPLEKRQKIAHIYIGESNKSTLSKLFKNTLHATNFYYSFTDEEAVAQNISNAVKVGGFDRIVISLANYSKHPANNFDISDNAIRLIKNIEDYNNATVLVLLGNPYAIKNFAQVKNIVACYEDDAIFQKNAFEFLVGKRAAKGQLPVTVAPKLPYGTGIFVAADN